MEEKFICDHAEGEVKWAEGSRRGYSCLVRGSLSPMAVIRAIYNNSRAASCLKKPFLSHSRPRVTPANSPLLLYGGKLMGGHHGGPSTTRFSTPHGERRHHGCARPRSSFEVLGPSVPCNRHGSATQRHGRSRDQVRSPGASRCHESSHSPHVTLLLFLSAWL